MDSGQRVHNVDVLVVELGDTSVGVLADRVVELHQVVLPTALPGAPTFVEGVVNLHGAVVPMTDLRGHLGLPARPLQPDDHLVVATVKGRAVAFRVDRAVAFTTVVAEHVHAVAGVARSASHVAGVVTTPDGLLLVHDLDALVSSDEVARTERLLSGDGAMAGPPR